MLRSLIRPLEAWRLVVDIVLAALFFLFTGFIPLDPATPWHVSPLIGAFMAVALAVRRWSPAIALTVAWAGAILQMSLGVMPLMSNLAILGVLYVTAAYGSRVVMWVGFASALVGAVTIALYLVLFPAWSLAGEQDLGQAIFVGASWLFAALFALMLSWTAGMLVRVSHTARENREAQARAEIAKAAEEERGRIARDMHDVVAHSLAVVVAQADGARYAADADPQLAKEALGTISQTARGALTDVRQLLAQLRHRQGDGPQPRLADLEGLFAQVRAAGIELNVDIDPAPPGEPPPAVQLAVYRILQEALTNALRHGDGTPVEAGLSWWPDRVTLDVRNHIRAARPARITADQDGRRQEGVATVPSAGRGASDPEVAPDEAQAVPSPGHGHGLIGMRERAQLVGGSLTAGPDGRIFVVRAELPIPAAEGETR